VDSVSVRESKQKDVRRNLSLVPEKSGRKRCQVGCDLCEYVVLCARVCCIVCACVYVWVMASESCECRMQSNVAATGQLEETTGKCVEGH
jgi:hypothetical protein